MMMMISMIIIIIVIIILIMMVKKMTKNIQYFFGVMSFSFAKSQKINILWNPPAASFSPNL